MGIINECEECINSIRNVPWGLTFYLPSDLIMQVLFQYYQIFCLQLFQLIVSMSTNERAVNSAGECHPHTVEVAGSNPVPPTI
jgi:hypothetical protein